MTRYIVSYRFDYLTVDASSPKDAKSKCGWFFRYLRPDQLSVITFEREPDASPDVPTVSNITPAQGFPL
jgi:hypothetical protein